MCLCVLTCDGRVDLEQVWLIVQDLRRGPDDEDGLQVTQSQQSAQAVSGSCLACARAVLSLLVICGGRAAVGVSYAQPNRD